MSHSIAILGAGAFGTAIAQVFARNNHEVKLWCFEESTQNVIQNTRINSNFLPHILLHNKIEATTNLSHALTHAEIICVAIPVPYIRQILEASRAYIQPGQLWISTSKGIEQETFLLPTNLIAHFAPNILHPLALSGPSFASDLALGKPTRVILATEHIPSFNRIARILNNDVSFSVEHSLDVTGVQLCGAFKNVIALIIGIAQGYKIPTNTQTLLFMSALKELEKLIITLQGNAQTVYSLAGLGDILLSSFSPQSRNYRVGYALGEGRTLKNIQQTHFLPEGINTLIVLSQLISHHSLVLPLFKALYEIVYEEESINRLIEVLQA